MFKLNLSKKGSIAGRKMIFYMILSFFLAIAGFLVVYITYSNLSDIAKIPEGLEPYILEQRFGAIPACFAYTDPDSGRIVPRTIDWASFTNESMALCYATKESLHYSFLLTLKNSQTDEEITIATPNWDRASQKSKTIDVTIIKDQIRFPGKLTIAVQQ
jgi:hypothetical protein